MPTSLENGRGGSDKSFGEAIRLVQEGGGSGSASGDDAHGHTARRQENV